MSFICNFQNLIFFERTAASPASWFCLFSASTAISTTSFTNFRLQGESSSSSRTTFNVTEEFLQLNTSNPETQSTEPNQNQNKPNIPSAVSASVLQKMPVAVIPQPRNSWLIPSERSDQQQQQHGPHDVSEKTSYTDCRETFLHLCFYRNLKRKCALRCVSAR